MRPPFLPILIAVATLGWTFHPGNHSAAVGGIDPGNPPQFTNENRSQPAARAGIRIGTSRSPHGLSAGQRREVAPLLARLDPTLLRQLSDLQQSQLLRYAANRLTHRARVACCWAPGTPPALMVAYHAVDEAARAEAPPADHGEAPPPPPADQFDRRWTRTAVNGGSQGAQGNPVTLTWSIVPDGTPIPSDAIVGDSDDDSNLRSFLAGLYPDSDLGPPEDQPWFSIFRGVFDNISARTGIRYIYEPSDDGQELGGNYDGVRGTRGDIRIGGHHIDGTSNVLAYNFFPNTGDMVIDTADGWFNNTGNASIRLANTIEHEHGHGLGAEHVCPTDNTKLMEPVINLNFRGLQFDDLYTIQRWYGDYYEHHSSERNNDSFTNAAPLAIPNEMLFTSEWLSIDDNDDIDYYSLALPAGSRVTIRVIPSSQAYLEGSQRSGSCSAGSLFDSSGIHDLSLELIAPNRTTILASSSANPAGQVEEILKFTTPQDGIHYLRVNGGSANAAQLYRLQVETAVPELLVSVSAQSITTESFSPPNAKLDPGETVVMELTLASIGALDAQNVQATLRGPAAFTGFSTTATYGSIASGAFATRAFTFGLNGGCGEVIELALTVSSDGASPTVLPVTITLGAPEGLPLENFDQNPSSLPRFWNSATTGTGSGWSISTAQADSGTSSVFAANLASVGQSLLISPPITLPVGGGTLAFSQSFHLESGASVGYDGGVLEISVAGGLWQDILTVGGSFAEGEYNRTISTEYNSALGGRRAWSGESGGFIPVVVDLPTALGEQEVRFRWRLAHDTSAAELGWFIDDVELTPAGCVNPSPSVALTLLDGEASEFDATNQAAFTLSTILPPIAEIPLTLLNTGSASGVTDVTGLESLVIPVGQTSLEVAIAAINDSELEGPETLVLSIDPNSGIVSTGASELSIVILDTPYNTWAAATLGLLGDNGPLGDFDNDGARNLEEFAWQTNGASGFSLPRLHPRRVGDHFRLDAPLGTLPAGVRVSAETSTDLRAWEKTGVKILEDGFQVALDGPECYLRLVYELVPSAPNGP